VFSVLTAGDFLDSLYLGGRRPEVHRLMGPVVAGLSACLEAALL
jgi:hypothetical protein